MKIAIRGGHNSQATGADGIINELIEDRKVKDAVIKYLRLDKNEVIDVTPGSCSSSVGLIYGVTTANNAKVDLFASIHFNNVSRAFTGAIGSEIWLNPGTAVAVTIANRILVNFKNLGFKNRGVKDGWNAQHLFEIRRTTMPAMIIEVCFVEATEDVRIYKLVGYDAVGKAIAEGIVNHKIGSGLQFKINMFANIQDVGKINLSSINDCTIGTVGLSKRIEAIAITIDNVAIKYNVYIQDVGDIVGNIEGEYEGTMGQSKRMEAITIFVQSIPSGYKLQYQVYIKTIGWQAFKESGQLAGTQGKSLQIEALRIRIIKI